MQAKGFGRTWERQDNIEETAQLSHTQAPGALTGFFGGGLPAVRRWRLVCMLCVIPFAAMASSSICF